jgi:hypothetical protein
MDIRLTFIAMITGGRPTGERAPGSGRKAGAYRAFGQALDQVTPP